MDRKWKSAEKSDKKVSHSPVQNSNKNNAINFQTEEKPNSKTLSLKWNEPLIYEP